MSLFIHYYRLYSIPLSELSLLAFASFLSLLQKAYLRIPHSFLPTPASQPQQFSHYTTTMLIPILTTTALLLPTVLADFPSDFTPGRCTFDAAVYQDCQGSHINTSLDVSEVYDGAGKHFMEPTDYIDLTDGATLSARVGETNMEIGFEGDSVTCTSDSFELAVFGQETCVDDDVVSYNGAQWPGEDDRFTCNIEPWSSERLDCDSEDRLQRVKHP
jgi:hypothetical protein